MTNAQIIAQASKEVSELAEKIDRLVDEYLKKSKMEANQRIVNVGRALNAYHIGWINAVSSQLDKSNDEILLVTPAKKKGAFIKPSLGALEKKKNQDGFVGVLFLLFMTLVVAASVGITKVGDHFQSKQKRQLESCIMEQIELSEQNRGSYFPRMRDELLHSFVMKCINDRDFREAISLSLDSPSNDLNKRKPVHRKTK